jgi:hypothetical protein
MSCAAFRRFAGFWFGGGWFARHLPMVVDDSLIVKTEKNVKSMKIGHGWLFFS